MDYDYSTNKQYLANNYNNTSLDQNRKYSYHDSFHTFKGHKVSQQEQIVSLLLKLISLLQNSSSSSKGTSSSISELTLNPGERYRLSQALNFNEASNYKVDNVLDLDQSYTLSSGDKVLGRNLGRPFEHIIGAEHLNYLEQTNSVILDLNLDELNAVDDAIYPYPNEGGMEAVFDNDLSGTVSIGDSALRASGFAGSSHEIPITSEHLARLFN